MRLLVMSDSHGRDWRVRAALEAHPEVGAWIHLGDGLREATRLAEEFPIPLYAVRGNCDFWQPGIPPESREEQFGGKRVFFTHGHLYGVKYGLYRVTAAAREREADILLFGHTHQPMTDYQEGLHILNPGSIGDDGSYALIDILPAGIMPLMQRL